MFVLDMAAQFLNRLGQFGLGVAVVGGVINSALYNGELLLRLITTVTYVQPFASHNLSQKRYRAKVHGKGPQMFKQKPNFKIHFDNLKPFRPFE